MSKFFINRPIVAMVISILMVIVGAVTIATLPVAQFPNIVPPEIRLQATYVGADAKTLEEAVATPIEQQINGVDNMDYMYSLNATGNSQTTILVDFDLLNCGRRDSKIINLHPICNQCGSIRTNATWIQESRHGGDVILIEHW